ncbi:MAG: hypothetical protein AB1330_01750 [Bacillota bacterium]
MFELEVRGQKVLIPDTDTWEREDGVRVVRTSRLEALAAEFGEEVPVPDLEYALIADNSSLFVAYKCVGPRTDGRVISSIGEGSPLNLESEIARQYPTIMAFIRAKARWITAALEMRGVYADVEFSDGIASASGTDEDDLGAYDGKENDLDAYEPQVDKTAAGNDVPGQTTITFGKYKGETIAEVYQADAGYLDWLTSKFEPKNREQRNLVAKVKQFYSELG